MSDLILKCSDWVLEQAFKNKQESIFFTTKDVAMGLNIPTSYVYNHSKEIKNELIKNPEIVWIDDCSGFKMKVNFKKSKTKSTATAEKEMTKEEKVQALKFVRQLFEQRVEDLESNRPAMKYTISKLRDCANEISNMESVFNTEKGSEDSEIDSLGTDPFENSWI